MGILKNISLIAAGALGQFCVDHLILSPKAEIEAHLPAAAAPPTPEQKVDTVQNMATYLDQTAGKIEPENKIGAAALSQTNPPAGAGTSDLLKVQDLLRDIAQSAGDYADPQKVRIFSQQAMTLFNQLNEGENQERITLLDGILAYPAVATQDDYKRFLRDLAEKYRTVTSPEQKNLLTHIVGDYLGVETDPTARTEFTEKYVNTPAPINDTPQAPPPTQQEIQQQAPPPPQDIPVQDEPAVQQEPPPQQEQPTQQAPASQPPSGNF